MGISMDREIVTEERLVELINERLASTEAASDCRFSGVYRLRELDANGCNWSQGVFNSGGIPPEVCSPVVNSVIRSMREIYNITDD